MKRLFLCLATIVLLTFPFPSSAAETQEDILDLFRPGMSRAEALERAKGAAFSEAAGDLRFRLGWASRTWDVTLGLLQGKTERVRWATRLNLKAAGELRELLRARGFVPAWYQERGRIDFVRLARRGMDREARLRLFDRTLDALLAAGDQTGRAVLIPESVFRECVREEDGRIAGILRAHREELFLLVIDKEGKRLILMTPDHVSQTT